MICGDIGGQIDVQPCKSKKSWLKYITKEDDDPYFNVKVSDLHFRYRTMHWCRGNRRLDIAHPFVAEHRFCYIICVNFMKNFIYFIYIRKSCSINYGQPRVVFVH